METETLRLLADAVDRARDAAAQTESGLCQDHIDNALRELRRAMAEAMGDAE